MHSEAVKINVEEAIKAGPIQPEVGLKKLMWLFVAIGTVTFLWSLLCCDPAHAWGVYYVCLLLFMGLCAGGCVIPAIFQIVGATWTPPIRRIAEANVAFMPYAYLLFLTTYAGKEYLFPWANAPMPGREWWMQPNFVYARMAVLMLFLFYFMWRFIRFSLRADLGLVMEKTGGDLEHSGDSLKNHILKGWKGYGNEAHELHSKLTWNAPLVIIFYALIYSLFSFEMIMGMDVIWFSNMFGGFHFLGNIYIAWAVLAITATYLTKISPAYASVLKTNQLWDVGKLTFAFCMLWGYTFFCQFLPQWYGNLPEETQWLILRTRDWDMPWIYLGWLTFAMCFVIPFVLLVSEDIKRSPNHLSKVGLIILLGVWLERYVIVMPQISPNAVPFGIVEIGVFLGFLGMYVLSIQGFLAKFPFVPLSSGGCCHSK